MDGKPRLLDRVREHIRLRRYSICTEHANVQWICRFTLFHGKRHPREMSAPEVEAFLSPLVVQRYVPVSTQNQALSAILLLYRDVLNTKLLWLQIVVRDGKGGKDRVTVLPDKLIAPLQLQLEKARTFHESDLEKGFGEVYLPYALAQKYSNAPKEWGW